MAGIGKLHIHHHTLCDIIIISRPIRQPGQLPGLICFCSRRQVKNHLPQSRRVDDQQPEVVWTKVGRVLTAVGAVYASVQLAFSVQVPVANVAPPLS